ncbi:MAG: 1-deoxy-D-xylulose-5-phosphate reductoisomerase [Firmicutes bacterium]|nr:1-deoxy-D-xylulose-5-phosphate reductoisomerase [Bacillota bacterium]
MRGAGVNGKKRIAVLGSTGSIGTQALEVIKKHSDILEVSLLASGTNRELAQKQAHEFGAKDLIMGDLDRLSDPHIYNGSDLVLNAIGGLSGLMPSLAVLESKANLASANKESIVAGGKFLMAKAMEKGKTIFPVDSEHSASFQCLESHENICKIILTASGGAFRNQSREEMSKATPETALNHPTWKMGKKVTIDSASLMNKTMEVIEAMWLFDTKNIGVLIHPQSIIHALVEFKDGSMKASLSAPDMRIPIQYAFTAPSRLSGFSSLNLAEIKALTFEEPNYEKYECLAFAEEVLNNPELGIVLASADEVAVSLFLNRKINFTHIPALVKSALRAYNSIKCNSVADIFRIEREVREYVLTNAGSIS